VEDPQQVIQLVGGGVIQEGMRGVVAVDRQQAVQDDALAELEGLVSLVVPGQPAEEDDDTPRSNISRQLPWRKHSALWFPS
jgi:hypothetical protein